MIKYVKEDLFKAPQDILIHGCNCFCKMGAGVAKQVRYFYPEAEIMDEMTVYGDRSKLGTYSCTLPNPHYYLNQDITIVNAYTQFSYSSSGRQCDYDAIFKVMNKIKEDFPDESKAMPKIGSGLAGGDWNIIEDIINSVFDLETVWVYFL